MNNNSKTFWLGGTVSAGGLITLPRITPTSKGIQISVVSIDNTVVFIYKHLFKSYKALLTWYGELLDRIN